jgi:hypothetical protein
MKKFLWLLGPVAALGLAVHDARAGTEQGGEWFTQAANGNGVVNFLGANLQGGHNYEAWVCTSNNGCAYAFIPSSDLYYNTYTGWSFTWKSVDIGCNQGSVTDYLQDNTTGGLLVTIGPNSSQYWETTGPGC